MHDVGIKQLSLLVQLIHLLARRLQFGLESSGNDVIFSFRVGFGQTLYTVFGLLDQICDKRQPFTFWREVSFAPFNHAP